MTRQRAESWDGLAVRISDDRLVLGPEAARILAAALQVYLRIEYRRAAADGGVSGPAAWLLHALNATAAHARRGHEDVLEVEESSESSTWISTTRAAELLGLSRRQVTRLATAEAFGPTSRSGPRLLVSETQVLAYSANRSRPPAPKAG